VFLVFLDSRIHLALRCDAFKAMLFGNMKEAQSGREPIPLPGVAHAAFLKLLEYLYTDEVGDLSHEVALDLLVVAESYVCRGVVDAPSVVADGGCRW
jgi:hypothetical protein